MLTHPLGQHSKASSAVAIVTLYLANFGSSRQYIVLSPAQYGNKSYCNVIVMGNGSEGTCVHW